MEIDSNMHTVCVGREGRKFFFGGNYGAGMAEVYPIQVRWEADAW